MKQVEVVGGGPAGAIAAIAALSRGCAVTIYEKSPFPRHKVCGEFLSPGISEALDQVLLAGAARLTRVTLHVGRREKSWNLPDRAFGLSRYTLDARLLDRAVAQGAKVVREVAAVEPNRIVANGRRSGGGRGGRLFGFKAHFQGPTDDSVNLYFFDGCYAGVSAVENGTTNVCALAPEALLRKFDFQPEPVLRLCDAVDRRLRPLARTMDWLITGPLEFRSAFAEAAEVYPAGDALGFIDPFTGSGILAAAVTGRVAGLAAADGTPVADYLRACRKVLARQYAVARVVRMAVSTGAADILLPLIPGELLFRLTRPA